MTLNREVRVPGTWSEMFAPEWFPSGDRVLYATGSVEAFKLVAQRADTTGGARELTAGVSGLVTPDGGTLIFLRDERGRSRLWKAPFQADGSLGAAQPVTPQGDPPDVDEMALSPDGRLLAYASRQPDGKSNVFLTDFPGVSGQWLVTEGGRQPIFSPDGKELFYMHGAVNELGQPRGQFMSSSVTVNPLAIGTATLVFDDVKRLGLLDRPTPLDRERFLGWIVAPGTAGEGTRLVLVQNWMAMVNK